MQKSPIIGRALIARCDLARSVTQKGLVFGMQKSPIIGRALIAKSDLARSDLSEMQRIVASVYGSSCTWSSLCFMPTVHGGRSSVLSLFRFASS